MRLLILSRSRALHSTKRLQQESQRLGIECIIVNPLRCQLSLVDGKIEIFVGTRKLENIDVVLPRIGTSITEYGLMLVRHFEKMGVPVLNSSEAILNSRNKFRCLQAMVEKKIPIPNSIMTRTLSDIASMQRRLGKFPIVMKLLQGAQGIGVMMAHDRAALESVMATLLVELDKDLLLQQFIRESKGSDVRVFVIDGKVVASMRRSAKAGEFRANIHRGGHGESVKIPKRYERIAIQAAKAVGLDIAGVDLLESDKGPLVLEVNSSPGFQELEKATGINIAEKMLKLALKKNQKQRKRR